MAGIGAELRRARTERKRSVEDVARATKINAEMIRAIENEAFARLPGGLFTRGFLRAYAREVGLDAEDIVERYRLEYEGGPAPAPETTAKPDEQVISSIRPAIVVDEETASSRRIQILQLFVIVLIVALYFAVSPRPRTTEVANEAAPAAPVAEAPKDETPAPAPAPVATKGTVAEEPPTELTLELHPTGPCWVEATAAGERVFSKLMDTGEKASVTLNKDLTLRVGDPGAFAFSIAGTPGRSLGSPGQPVTVRMSLENYKTYLQSKP